MMLSSCTGIGLLYKNVYQIYNTWNRFVYKYILNTWIYCGIYFENRL